MLKLLNLGCGDVRPPLPFLNVDNLADTLDPNNRYHAPVLQWIANEPNYMHFDLRERVWPWESDSIDGIACNHCMEHFDAIDLQRMLKECYRILKPGGVMRVSVPDASYFRLVHADDNRENAKQLFGEENRHPDYETFMGWALFLYDDHRQVFTEDSLWCTIVNRECPRNGSFAPEDVVRTAYRRTSRPGHYCAEQVAKIDFREMYSLFVEAFKK